MKKYCIEMTRKLFYVFDMVLLALLFFSLEHTLFREDIIIDTMLDVALWLRIIIPFLLYRYEEKAVWPITIFVALFGYVYYSDALYNTIQTMGHFPSIMFNSIPSLERHMMSVRDTTGMVVMRGIIYWIWLIPFAAYIIQTACKLTKDNDYPWYYFLGGIMFNDKVAKTYLRMASMLAIAYLIGYEMQENLSYFAIVSLSLACFYYWNKHINREPYWIEYVVLLVGLYLFNKAQYKVDNERITYLVTSATIIFGGCCWMAYSSKNIFISFLAFMMVAFLYPTVSLGYNVYQCIEGSRTIKYVNVGLSNNKGYMYIKRRDIINGKEVRLIGVRDRYRTTIPCEYSSILPTGLYSPFAKCVKCVGEKRDSVVRSVEEGYVLE